MTQTVFIDKVMRELDSAVKREEDLQRTALIGRGDFYNQLEFRRAGAHLLGLNEAIKVIRRVEAQAG